jgi:hypothetical protein
MALKVWRGKAALFAECTACGSYGTAGHLQVQNRLDPDIQAALDKHEARMLTLRGHFTTAVNNIVRQIKNGSLERKVGSKQVADLQQNFTGQIVLAHNSLPSPQGKVAEFVSKCPWCEVVEEVDVIPLPDGVDEPPFEQAKAVATFQAKAAAEAAKQKGKGK